MRGGAASLVLGLAVSLPVAGKAQDFTVDAIFAAGVEECTRFYADPQAYLSSLPVPGPAGERVFASSPDKMVLWVMTIIGRMDLEAHIAVVGKSTYRTCRISGVVGEQGVEAVEAQVRRRIAAISPAVSGGVVPWELPELDGGVASHLPFPTGYIYWPAPSVGRGVIGLAVSSGTDIQVGFIQIDPGAP